MSGLSSGHDAGLHALLEEKLKKLTNAVEVGSGKQGRANTIMIILSVIMVILTLAILALTVVMALNISF